MPSQIYADGSLFNLRKSAKSADNILFFNRLLRRLSEYAASRSGQPIRNPANPDPAPPDAIRNPASPDSAPQDAIRNPESPDPSPPDAIRNPESLDPAPPDAICNPESLDPVPPDAICRPERPKPEPQDDHFGPERPLPVAETIRFRYRKASLRAEALPFGAENDRFWTKWNLFDFSAPKATLAGEPQNFLMPYRRLPNSVAAVIRTLITARDQYVATTNPAERAITAEQFAKLDPNVPTALLNVLLKEASDVDRALAAQAPLSSAVPIIAARATMFAAHFHRVLDLGIERGAFAPGSRAYYKRGLHDTTIPDLTTYAAVKTVLEQIETGEQARANDEGASHTPMTNPSAPECSAILAQFAAALAGSSTAQQTTDREREQLAPIYAAAQALAVDICDTVEFFYRHDKVPGSFRNKCRPWGVVYVFEPNEPQDPADPTAPTPPAPPTPPTP
jgi:hypothetical protein